RDYIDRVKEFSIVDGDERKWGKNINDLEANPDWDMNRPKDFRIERPALIRDIKADILVVVVTCDKYYAGPGAEIGNMLIREYGLQEGKELYFLDKLNNSMDMHLSSTSTPCLFIDGF
ncbi:MAG: hypothetical protein K2P64_10295, partial [Lachnospiraceae bacterium]|nr:hypothetical protein [Lachnospiraceae bacterium]